MNNVSRATLIELFSSVQGEGPFVGYRQVFLRFSGCNLTCDYCDTNSSTSPDFCNLEGTPGRRDFVAIPNPVSLTAVDCHLREWGRGWPGVHHSLSLTGGEPLLAHEVLREWLPVLRRHLPIYLETNGLLAGALLTLLSNIDYISMDFKLPSTSGMTNLWDDHAAFLDIASAKEVFVKIVIGAETEEWEIIRSCELIRRTGRILPLILQPVTRQNGSLGISPLKVLEFQELAARYLTDVRVIPQTHKFMDQL